MREKKRWIEFALTNLNENTSYNISEFDRFISILLYYVRNFSSSQNCFVVSVSSVPCFYNTDKPYDLYLSAMKEVFLSKSLSNFFSQQCTVEFFLAFSFIVRPRSFPWCFHNQFFVLRISDLQKIAQILVTIASIDIFLAFSSRDVDMICENWHTHLNCTLGAHCSRSKAAGRNFTFLQTSSIYEKVYLCSSSWRSKVH